MKAKKIKKAIRLVEDSRKSHMEALERIAGIRNLDDKGVLTAFEALVGDTAFQLTTIAEYDYVLKVLRKIKADAW